MNENASDIHGDQKVSAALQEYETALKEASFSHTRFRTGIVFRNVKVDSHSSFSGAHFGKSDLHVDLSITPELDESEADIKCLYPHDFSAARFDSAIRFTGDAPLPYPGFRRCNFNDRADFSGLKWDPDTFYGSLFEGARFLDVADMRCDNFSAFEVYNLATFKETVLLGPAESEWQQRKRFLRASSAAMNEIRNLNKMRYNKDQAISSKQLQRQVWSQLSGGYRVLKTAMKAVGDFDREQTFYRYEVRSRLKAPGVGVTEKLASVFYSTLSDYGASIGRPFVGLVIFTLLFSGLYLVIATFALDQIAISSLSPSNFDSQRALQSLEFSVNNAAGPLSGLGLQDPSTNPDANITRMKLGPQLLYSTETPWAILVRLVSFTQSLVSIVLAFLVGLAIRRKFQIA